MLYESNRVGYFINKYVTILIGLVIVEYTITYIVQNYATIKLNASTGLISAIILLLLVLCVWIHLKFKDKWKIVAIGRSKIIVDDNKEEREYNWLDVEYIQLDKFLRFYTMKIRGREEILFTPYGFVNLFTGDESEMGLIIKKMKRELGI